MVSDYPENGQNNASGFHFFSPEFLTVRELCFAGYSWRFPTFPAAPEPEKVAGLISRPEISTGPLFSGLAEVRNPRGCFFQPCLTMKNASCSTKM
jgi:hypothetical protein